MTGCTLAEADEARRALGDPDAASRRSGPGSCRRRCGPATTWPTVERVWEVLKAFGSFGFCKAHAAAFALPTYQSAWLKAHHPAAFLAGVLTHDPGMYPKRLILDDARQFGIADPRASTSTAPTAPTGSRRSASSTSRRPRSWVSRRAGRRWTSACPTARAYGIRMALSDVKGINEAEVARIVGGPAVRVAVRLLAPGRGVPADRGAAGPGRGVRLASTTSAVSPRSGAAAGSPGGTCCCRSPSSIAWSRALARGEAVAPFGRACRAAPDRRWPVGTDVVGRAARQSQARPARWRRPGHPARPRPGRRPVARRGPPGCRR